MDKMEDKLQHTHLQLHSENEVKLYPTIKIIFYNDM